MKKLMAFFVLVLVSAMGIAPAFADDAASNTGADQVKNVKVGSRNTSTAWVEVLDATHAEASKGKNVGEHLTGLVAGTAVGARNTIHRMGAGAIDLITFWIPKKQPLVNPEKARLE